MQIFMLVLQILSTIAPMIARMLAAINESMSGGVKQYDKLLSIALEQVDHVAAVDWGMPGASDFERNLKKASEAAKATKHVADAIGLVVKDREINKAVEDAYILWRQMGKGN